MHSTDSEADIGSDVWAAALIELEGRYSKPIFQMWLRPMRVVGFSASSIELSVQTKFARDWAENRLKDDIARTLEVVALGSPVEVSFKVAPRSSSTGIGPGRRLFASDDHTLGNGNRRTAEYRTQGAEPSHHAQSPQHV